MLRGTRVPVPAMFESLKDDVSLAEFVEIYPVVTTTSVPISLIGMATVMTELALLARSAAMGWFR